MKIAVDCRYLSQTGIGKYLEGILQEFNDDKRNEFLLIGNKELLGKYAFPILHDETDPLSKAGLKIDVGAINKCDAFFTPNYVIPAGIKVKIYSMIHDVVFLDCPENEKGFLNEKSRYQYIKEALSRSEKVFTVSETTKQRIIDFKKNDKLVVAYPALTKQIIEYEQKGPKDKYVLFIGNAYKSKGIDVLLELAKELRSMNRDIPIKIVGEYSNFRSSDSAILDYARGYNIEFTGRVSDEQLCDLISQAKFLIQPSRYEGFGVPPLEALYLKTKPIISDIRVFHEVYEGLDVEFFKTNNAHDLYLKVTTTKSAVRDDQQEKILRRYNYRATKDIIINTITGRI